MNEPLRISGRMGLLALLALAALLRFGGISHDLHEGRVYHPDAPKQIRAIQQFWAGEYYRHIGLKDYDGYPLLHAHLVEYALRVVEPVRRAGSQLLGIPTTGKGLLDADALYWIVLLMNAALSTAGVGLVFRIGRENIGPAAGWIAAALLAVSPADITAAHMATGDVTTAFFATLSLWHAMRVHRLGRLRDYLWCTALATFAFAAKYYSATAFFTLAAAHLFRQGLDRPARWFDAESLRKIGWCAAVAVASLFLAVPGLFAHFGPQLADIWSAMMVSTQRFPVDMANAGRGAKFVYSMKVNLPDLLRCVTVVTPLAVVFAVVTRLRRDARVWILLIAPVLYVFLAVGSRGPVNPVYHSSVTPPLFLLIGLCAQSVAAETSVKRWPVWAAALVALGLLLPVAYREFFFARHMDTRRLSEEWVRENVPESFRVHTGRYTFDRPWTGAPGREPAGHVTVSSELDPLRDVPPIVLPFKRFELERDPLTQFRNIPQNLSIFAPELVRAGFTVPVTQTIPSQSGNEFVLLDGPEFLRNELSWTLEPGLQVARRIVSARPLSNAWIIVRSDAQTIRVRMTFDRRSLTIRADGAGTAMEQIKLGKAGFPSTDGLYHYRLTVETLTAPVRLTIAFTPRAAGLAAANAGRWREATPLLAQAPDPLAAALAKIGASKTDLTSSLPADMSMRVAQLASVTNATACFATFGLHPDFLDGLPFLSFSAGKLESEGCTDAGEELVAIDAKNVKDTREIRTRPLFLDPGPYQVRLSARVREGAPPEKLRLEVTTAEGKVLSSAPLSLQTPVTTGLCNIPVGAGSCRIVVRWDGPSAFAIGGLDIRPDVLGNLRAIATMP